MLRLAKICAVVFCVAACSEQAHLAQLPAKLVLEHYVRGVPKARAVIDRRDDRYLRLKKLLSSEQTGWTHDLVTYAPQYLFTGKGIRINCFPDLVVIDYVDGETSRSISKHISNVYAKLGFMSR
jgi:hypothetical protein